MKNYGINIAREVSEQDGTEYLFGGMTQPCLYAIDAGRREENLPAGELQRGAEDTSDCATRAPMNIIETKFTYSYQIGIMLPENRRWLEEKGYIVNGRIMFSDAFIAILSGTTRTGNSLKAPLQAIHEHGLIPKQMLPLEKTMTFDEYMNPARITPAMKTLGKEFKTRFRIEYHQVRSTFFKEANKDDMLVVAGYGWSIPIDGEYPAIDFPLNHAWMNIRPDIYAFDNYLDREVAGDFIKKLAPDYKFWDWGYVVVVAKEYSDDERAKLTSLFQKLLNLLAKILLLKPYA